jgi:DNA replication protein DnaC
LTALSVRSVLRTASRVGSVRTNSSSSAVQGIGHSGTGKTHLAIALGLAACRQGRRVRFFTAAGLVNRLEEAQKQYQLDRLLEQLNRAELLICDELGYLSFSRTGAELLFQVFAERYGRRSLLVTSNLPFGE